MHPVILYSGIFFLLGGIITYITNKKREKASSIKSWIKFYVYLFIAALWIFCLLFHEMSRIILSIAVLLIGFLELINLYRKTHDRSKLTTTFSISLLIYGILAWGFFNHILEFNSIHLIFVFFIVFAFDGFSQIFGQLLGKRKILPYISPGKTVEGFIGGLIMAVVAGLSIATYSGISPMKAIALGFIIGLASFFGDLIASLNKRKYKVKDYSQLIPGHGGILDRFDSWLLAGAVAYFLMDWIIKY